MYLKRRGNSTRTWNQENIHTLGAAFLSLVVLRKIHQQSSVSSHVLPSQRSRLLFGFYSRIRQRYIHIYIIPIYESSFKVLWYMILAFATSLNHGIHPPNSSHGFRIFSGSEKLDPIWKEQWWLTYPQNRSPTPLCGYISSVGGEEAKS